MAPGADLLRQTPTEDRERVADGIAYLGIEDTGQFFPRYWDVPGFVEEYSFEWDERVERRLRGVIEKLNLVENSDDDWGFPDLAFS